jgi:opacity protein-like surface antigen
MKNLAFLALSLAALSSSAAFAQSSPPPSQIIVASAAPQSVATSSPTNVQKTGSAAPLNRVEVLQELVAAQKDGSLARLNREFYSGGQ